MISAPMKTAAAMFFGSLLALGVGLMPGCGPSGSPPASDDKPQVDYQKVLAHSRERQSGEVKLGIVKDAIQRFQVNRARLPHNLQEVVGTGFLPEIPPLPPDRVYRYDPTYGTVWIAPVDAKPRPAPAPAAANPRTP